jgi:hypothetical protein
MQWVNQNLLRKTKPSTYHSDYTYPGYTHVPGLPIGVITPHDQAHMLMKDVDHLGDTIYTLPTPHSMQIFTTPNSLQKFVQSNEGQTLWHSYYGQPINPATAPHYNPNDVN